MSRRSTHLTAKNTTARIAKRRVTYFSSSRALGRDFGARKESFVADGEGAGGVAMMKRMNGWNRLFIVAAVCWVLVAPVLAMKAANDPVDRVVDMCGTSAYRNYGASASIIRLDMDQYHAEVKKCLDAWTRDVISPQKLFSALIGTGDRALIQMAWGLILIPLCLLWVVGWVLGKTVKWIAAGFRQT
jgi:hypothetical protein